MVFLSEYDIVKILKEKKPLIDRAIAKYIPRRLSKKSMILACGKARFGYDLKSATASINKPIWDLLDRGGKRWRPALFLLFVEAMGKNQRAFVDYSIIPELVHNGSLMVDDIEDCSDLRRGKPCTHHLFGIDVAINAGNALYYLPLITLIQSKFSPRIRSLAYEAYIQEMINLSYGQGLDIHWHRGGSPKVTEKQYLQMCAFKTGTLARLSAKLGVILPGGSVKKAKVAGEFAEAIGVAFQIQDDVLNLVGDEKVYGKETGGDISEGKRTLMVIHSLNHLPKNKAKKLLSILNSHTKSRSKIREAISLIKSTNSINYAQKIARSLVSRAWKKLDSSFSRSPAKSKLKAFADYLIERDV